MVNIYFTKMSFVMQLNNVRNLNESEHSNERCVTVDQSSYISYFLFNPCIPNNGQKKGKAKKQNEKIK